MTIIMLKKVQNYTMKLFPNNNFFPKFTALAVIIFSTGCATVDQQLGTDLIPDKLQMKVEIDTLTEINAYTCSVDSLITSRWEEQYLGSMISPEFGRTQCDLVSEYLFNGFHSDSMWGDNPTIDSVVLMMTINSTIGDTNYVHTISMYDLKQSLPDTNVFAANFDISGYVDSEPIATFSGKSNQQYIKAHLPKSYGERYLDTTGRIYLDDELFYKKFPGSYFKVALNNNEGSILELDMTNTQVVIFYHNQNKPTPDTSNLILSYTNDVLYAPSNGFTIINHDYSLADPIKGIDASTINDTINSQKKTYVQGMCGLMTRIEIPQEQIDKIKNKVKALGYSNIVINNAVLLTPLLNPSTYSMNISLPRLGMYYNYQMQQLIPDYNPYVEDDSYELPYGGYLNRAFKGYKMDITTYVQYLFSGKTNQNKTDLACSIGFEEYPTGCFLDNGTSEPMKLSITYTMIK